MNIRKIFATLYTLGILSVAASAMELPRGAYEYKNLADAKAEAIKKKKPICFFVT